MMRPLFILLVVTALCAGGAFVPELAAAPKQEVMVAKAVPFSEESGGLASVKKECKLETKLPEFIQAYSKKTKVVLNDAPPATDAGRVLVLEFTDVIGMKGGAWSGAKSLVATGKLYENGKVIGTFTSARYSTGGAFAGFKGTCSIFGRCVKSMGKDIAGWLEKPTMDAMLGDAS